MSINDNTIEITSPGLLPPSIDYNDMLSRQWDVRNKVLAPVFKRLGLIDQWGNGLALIHNELKAYPNVRMTWKEVGLSFQVAFERMALASAESTQETLSKQSLAVLGLLQEDSHITRNQIAERLNVSPDAIKKHLTKLRRLGYIEHVGSTKNGYWRILK